MTGAYLRAFRNNNWVNVEVEHLTSKELHDKFIGRTPEELVRWMTMLCETIRSNEIIFKDLEKDGILKSVSREEMLAATATADSKT